ncbi:hypothetical protein GQR58_000278 [Nymphon striatum]|nr:hypothetical protein GQR58_000278 [Nymphon striatum]
MDEISYQIRNIIVQEFSRTLARAGIPVLDMAANTRELGQLVAREIAPQLAEYGLSLPELYIENISLPPAVEEVMDKRSSMGVIGNLNEYMQFQAAEALGRDGAGAAAIQAGMGAGLGMQIGQAVSAGPLGQPSTPSRRGSCSDCSAPSARGTRLAHCRKRRDNRAVFQSSPGPNGRRWYAKA